MIALKTIGLLLFLLLVEHGFCGGFVFVFVYVSGIIRFLMILSVLLIINIRKLYIFLLLIVPLETNVVEPDLLIGDMYSTKNIGLI